MTKRRNPGFCIYTSGLVSLSVSRSFNRWLVRYIYVPLGGARPGRQWNVFVVFIFVALWHDVETKLFLWGMLNGVFFVVEAGVRNIYNKTGAFERCRANSLTNRSEWMRQGEICVCVFNAG